MLSRGGISDKASGQCMNAALWNNWSSCQALCEQLQQRLLTVMEEVHGYDRVVSELKEENQGLQLRTEKLGAELGLGCSDLRMSQRLPTEWGQGMVWVRHHART